MLNLFTISAILKFIPMPNQLKMLSFEPFKIVNTWCYLLCYYCWFGGFVCLVITFLLSKIKNFSKLTEFSCHKINLVNFLCFLLKSSEVYCFSFGIYCPDSNESNSNKILYETLGAVVMLTSGMINWLNWITHFFLNQPSQICFWILLWG